MWLYDMAEYRDDMIEYQRHNIEYSKGPAGKGKKSVWTKKNKQVNEHSEEEEDSIYGYNP